MKKIAIALLAFGVLPLPRAFPQSSGKFVLPRLCLADVASLASEPAPQPTSVIPQTKTEAPARDVLGSEQARNIVFHCANSTAWTMRVQVLQLDSGLFEACLVDAINKAGYSIRRKDIIGSNRHTRLYEFVMSIQDAPRLKVSQ